jgi:hypothetical protein
MYDWTKTIEVHTLASLTADDPEILTRIITEGDYPNDYTKLRSAFLQRFRYRMIGSCSASEWEEVVTDTAEGMAWIWNQIFDGVRSKNLGDMTDRTATVSTHTESESMPDISTTATQYLDNRSDVVTESSNSDVTNMRGIKELLADLKDPYAEWCKEFDEFFLNRLADAFNDGE